MTAGEIHGGVGSIPRWSRLWTLSNGKKHPLVQVASTGGGTICSHALPHSGRLIVPSQHGPRTNQIACLTSAQVEVVYRPLASPAVLVFFIFIILSTLRLSPWIGALSGTVAAVTYICAALYLGWRPPLLGAPAPVTQTSVSLYAVTLLLGGLVAGAVAGQIRKHVQS